MGRSRHTQQAGALVALLAFSNAAFAEDNPAELRGRLIPEYTPCEFEKQRYACFDEQQVLELYTLEVQAKDWYRKWHLYEELSIVQDTQLKLQLEQLDRWTTMNERSQAYSESCTDQNTRLTMANSELAVEIEHPPRWPLWLGGALTAFGLGALTFAIAK